MHPSEATSARISRIAPLFARIVKHLRHRETEPQRTSIYREGSEDDVDYKATASEILAVGLVTSEQGAIVKALGAEEDRQV